MIMIFFFCFKKFSPKNFTKNHVALSKDLNIIIDMFLVIPSFSIPSFIEKMVLPIYVMVYDTFYWFDDKYDRKYIEYSFSKRKENKKNFWFLKTLIFLKNKFLCRYEMLNWTINVNNNMLVNCFLCDLDINWEDQTPTGLPVYMFVPYIRRFENAKILVTVHNSNMVTYRYFRNGKALENFLLFDF